MQDERVPPTVSKPESFADAYAWLGDGGTDVLNEQIELARIPSPPFQEHDRAKVIATKLESMGVKPESDDVGNLLAWYPVGSDTTASDPIVIASHMDTVFGPDIPIEIKQEDERWVGPGITDNARGLAVILAVLRSLIRCSVELRHPLLFAFTVGEEGPGDLRGVKHLFAADSPLRSATAFIAVDGTGLRRIIHHALGSRRFRVTIRGAGGHSWTDWGRSNPANAAGEFIHRLAELALPENPRATLTVARHGGGTSINAIPAESWVELDLRSEDADTLHLVESSVREALHASIAAEEARADGALSVEVTTIGERPAGRLSTSHALVQAALQATRDIGEDPEHAVSSTDANVPLAAGVPAIAIGGGGKSANTHTQHEWFENTDGPAGALRLLHIIRQIAG
jgi:acetylornithine deacetylase/succinyl-diaminopimelate desuccinylase-like protein